MQNNEKGMSRCPKCGGVPEVKEHNYYTGKYIVRCISPGCYLESEPFRNKADAADYWRKAVRNYIQLNRECANGCAG